jgi:tRNA nucleotidyltransferase (CCA-adding enzyme)
VTTEKRPNLIPLDGELKPARAIIRTIINAGGRPLFVGGCVRDALLGLPSKDLDIEVHGLPAETLKRALRARHDLISVGQSFGVFKLLKLPIDISLPRREMKTGAGHRGFAIWGDPRMGIPEAAARRDFTINALYWDPANDALLDPHNGLDDLRKRVLRHTSPAFAEDPLRVLRAMQFIARYQLVAAPETIALCRRIEPEGLPAERIFEEWTKLLLKGEQPSLGLHFLNATGWLRHYPELHALAGCPQDPQWHPEGDVWEHTLHCLDAFAQHREGDKWEDLVVGLAVLCHDFGKPATTRLGEDGRWHAYGHEAAGGPPTRAFLQRMTRHKELIESVVPLVECHMRPLELHRAKAGDAAIQRLAQHVTRIDRLVRVDAADQRGRPPRDPGELPHGKWLLERATALSIKASAPKPILRGRDLIQLGLAPGREFRAILSEAFEAQLDGAFSDATGAVAWARNRVNKR